MNTKETAKHLNNLIQLDIDAVHAYTEAIKEIDVTAVRQRITEFREDHERHIRELTTAVRDLGETPTEHKPDIKGFFLKGMTAIRSKTGTSGALKAMKTNEELTNKKYAEAHDTDLPPTVRPMVDRFYEDERRHLEYINHAITEKIWER